jgi:hypothetical protein
LQRKIEMPLAPGPSAALVRKLADLLAQCPVGQRVRYQELSHAIGAPIDDKRYLVVRAILLANKETGCLFMNVRGVGYQRLPAENILGHYLATRRSIRRKCLRGEAIGRNILAKANDISNETRLHAYGQQAILGLIRYGTYDRNVPEVAKGHTPPPTHETVRATIEALRQASPTA